MFLNVKKIVLLTTENPQHCAVLRRYAWPFGRGTAEGKLEMVFCTTPNSHSAFSEAFCYLICKTAQCWGISVFVSLSKNPANTTILEKQKKTIEIVIMASKESIQMQMILFSISRYHAIMNAMLTNQIYKWKIQSFKYKVK